MFQTAAEILLHHEDFLNVLKTVKAPNRKIQAVHADLLCSRIITVFVVAGLMYVRVTGPYWQLVTSGKVSYLEIYPHIQSLHSFLTEACDSPEKLYSNCIHWHPEDFDITQKNKFSVWKQRRENNWW